MPQPRDASRSATFMLILDEGTAGPIAALLTAQGHVVHRCESGEEALETLQKGLIPQCILMTPVLPGIDGWRLCRILRAFPACRRIPILILTTACGRVFVARISSGLGPGVMLVDRSDPTRLGEQVRRVLDGDITGELVPVLMIAARGRVTSTLRRVFKQHGFSLRSTTTPAGARRLLRDTPPAVVLYDTDAPAARNGIAFDHLGHLAPGAPWIVLSGSPSYAAELLRKGAWMVATKPVTPGRLVALCEQALSEQAMLVAEEGQEPREQRLAESEARYRVLFENAIEGIYRTSLDGRLLLANPALARMFGYGSPQEAMERIMDIGAQIYADPQERARIIPRLLMEGEITGYEVTFKRADGTPVWVVLNFYLQRDASGIPLYIEGTCVDITERKQAEEELRASEERLQALARASFEAIAFSEKGICFDVNEVATHMSGYSRAELIGMKLIDLTAPESRAEVQRRLNQKSEEPYTAYCLRKDGSRYPTELRGRMFTYRGREVRATAIRDVSDRVRAEQALKQSEEKYRALVENARVVVLQWDPSGNVAFMNEFGLTLFGYREEELIGRNVMGAIVPQTESSGRDLAAMIAEICRDPERFRDNENENITNDGRRIWMHWSNKAIMDESGALVGILSIGSDITARKLAEDLLRRERDFTHNLIESSPAFIITIGADGRIRMMNRAMLTALGYELAEVIGTDYAATFVPESERAGLAALFERMRRTGEMTVNENPVRARDGREVLIEWHGCLLECEDGAFDSILGIGIDITARKQTEQELQAWMQRYELIVEASGQVAYDYIVPTGRITWGASLERVLGLTPEEMNGGFEQWVELLHPDDRDATLRTMEAAEQACAFWEARYRMRHKDGGYRWIRDRGFFLSGSDGQAYRQLGMMEDITATQEAEAELSFRATLLVTLQEASIDGILVVDADRRILSFNRRFIDIWGIPKEVLESRDDERTLQVTQGKVADPEGFQAMVQFYYTHPTDSGRNEILFADGRTIDNYTAPVRGEDGVYYGRVWYVRDVTEEKRAAEALRLSEEKYRSIFENAMEGMFQSSPEGRYFSVNPAFARMFGFTSPEEMMASISDIGHMLYVHPEERELLGKILAEQGHVENFEVEVHRRNGTPLWISVNSRIVRGQDGALLYYEGSTFEITERRAADERLRDAIKRLEDIIEFFPDATLVIDQDGKVLSWNKAMEDLSGLPKAEIVGKHHHQGTIPFYGHARPSLIDLLDKDDKDLAANYANVVRKGAVLYAETFAPALYHGRGAHIMAVASQLFDREGRTVGFIESVRDITERWQAEAALRDSEEKYRLVVDNAREAIFIAQDGMFKFANPYVVEILGYPTAELYAAPFERVIHPDDRALVTDRHQRRLCGETVPEVYTFRVVNRAGMVRWVELNVILIEWEGRPATLNFLADITERRAAEERLREANKRLEDIIEFLPDATLIMDQDKRIIAWNKAIEEMTGVPKAEMLGKDRYYGAVPFYGFPRPFLMDLIDKDDAEIAALYEHIVRKGVVLQAEVFAPALYGNRGASVFVAASPLLDSEGRTVGAIESVRDITEAKQAEEALKLSEEKFAKAFNASPVVISLSALEDGTYLEINEAFLRMSGYAREEVIGRTTADLGLWVDLQDRERFLAEITKMGRVRDFEARFRMRGGGIREGILSAEIVVFRGRRCLLSYNIDITERKRAEDALRASEELYRLLTENAYDMISRHAPDGTVRYVSPASRRMLGYDPEEMIGRPDTSIVHPDDLPGVWDIMNRRFQEGAETYTLQHRTIRKDGSWLWIETAGRFIRNADGSLKEIQCGVRDISERMRALEALRASEEKFRSVVESSPTGMHLYRLEEDGRLIIVGANPAADRALGVKREDVLGKTIEEAFPHLAGTGIPEIYARVARREIGPQAFEATSLDERSEGRTFEVNVFSTGPGSIAVDFTDISARKRAEEALSAAHAKLQATMQAIPDLLFETDRAGRIYDYHAPFRDELYAPPEMFLGKMVHEVLPPHAAAVIAQALAEAAQQGWHLGGVYDLEMPSGRRWFELSIAVKSGGAGEDKFIITTRNITERKRAEAELVELDRELKRKNQELESIVYATSHDLRSPLLNIQGFGMRLEAACADLLEILRAPVVPAEVRAAAGPILDDSIPKALKFIHSSVEKMDSLIKGLLQLSRLGRAELIMLPLDVKALLDQVISAIGFQIQQAGATIELGDLPPCRGDASQLSQVFSNLIDNALKYRSPERELRIRVSGRIEGDQCVYCVEDNGVGIPEAHREKIWELFHRLEPGGAVSGEGLGLTVVRRILDRHKGKVWVEETEAGAGSRFCFTLEREGTGIR